MNKLLFLITLLSSFASQAQVSVLVDNKVVTANISGEDYLQFSSKVNSESLPWISEDGSMEFDCDHNIKECSLILNTHVKSDLSFAKHGQSISSGGGSATVFLNKEAQLKSFYKSMNVESRISFFGHEKKKIESQNGEVKMTCTIPGYVGSVFYTCSFEVYY